MSFTSIATTPFRFGSQLLRGPTLASMGRTVGIVGAAGALAAVYQLAGSEMQRTVDSFRVRGALRAQRHEAVRVQMLTVSLSGEAQRKILGARDAYETAMGLVASDRTNELDRASIRSALLAATNIRAD